MICWSAKWLMGETVFGETLTPKEAREQNDKRIVESLRELLNSADIIITHNGKRFDVPKINTRLLLHNLSPVAGYHHIDTCEIARRQFGFSSNKLDFIATSFGIPNKLHTTFELWSGCVEGNRESLENMLTYNKRDVEILESVYLRLRPWIKNHPNVALYYESDEMRCPNCGGQNLTEGKIYYTSVQKYMTYTCECGATARVRQSIPIENADILLTNNLR